MCLRSDFFTGYTYDFNVYTGRETERLDGTLGERVVNKLIFKAKEKDITFCSDHFFTSTNLLLPQLELVIKIEKLAKN